jgi:Do/DeqQ family serine protease
MKRVAAVVGIVIVLAALVWALSPQVQRLGDTTHPKPPLTTAKPGPVAAPVLQSLNPVLSQVSGAVVNISVEATARAPANPLMEDPMFRRFFGQRGPAPRQRTRSVGSGVIIDAEHGYIITNHHVIDGADHIAVTLTDRRELNAELVGSDPEIDIAVLRVDAANLTALPVGDSDDLKIGDFVIAMGNPFGIGQASTLGIVSALGRSGLGIEGYEDFIQTDASINPGNSGGALIDQTGQLVGINTAILSRSGGNIGIGFAIPANMALRAAEQIIEYGAVQRGQIGVMIQDLTPELAEAMRIDPDAGALVSDVLPGTPAEDAGLQPGDVITAIDGRSISGGTDLRNQVGLMRPGRDVRLDVFRDGKTLKVDLKLDDMGTQARQGSLGDRFEGLELGPVPGDHPMADRIEGVFVRSVAPGSTADRAGLRRGDIIVGVNRRPVAGMGDLLDADRQSGDRPLLLHVRRGNGSLFLALE